ncbi:MAG: cupin domain-containing protein [Ilumatobacteraceae bacterium]
MSALVPDSDAFVRDALFRSAVWSPGEGGPRPGFVTSAELWADAVGRGLRQPGFRLVRDGKQLSTAETCRKAGIGHRTLDDVFQPNRVLELHAAGATMVLQGLQLSDPRLARLANNLALDLGHAVQINAYLSPVAAKGLELHFDFHDVFVLQLDGRKRWRVWEPLARTHQPVRGGPKEPMPTFDELGEPAMDLTLRAGDCLYLPRGFPHAAETVDAASSHLTIGVMAPAWHQAVRHAVDEAVSDRATTLRASIPGDVAGPPDLAAIAVHLDPDVVQQWMIRETWKRQPATRLRPLVAPTIDLGTELTITPGPLLWLLPSADRVELGLGDRSLTLPAEAGPLLAALLTSDGSFTLADLDVALDDDSRLVVGQRLVIEGVVAPV